MASGQFLVDVYPSKEEYEKMKDIPAVLEVLHFIFDTGWKESTHKKMLKKVNCKYSLSGPVLSMSCVRLRIMHSSKEYTLLSMSSQFILTAALPLKLYYTIQFENNIKLTYPLKQLQER